MADAADVPLSDEQRRKRATAEYYRDVCDDLVATLRDLKDYDYRWQGLMSGQSEITFTILCKLYPDKAPTWKGLQIDALLLRDVLQVFKLAQARYPNEYLSVKRPSLECFSEMYEAVIRNPDDEYDKTKLPYLLDPKRIRDE